MGSASDEALCDWRGPPSGKRAFRAARRPCGGGQPRPSGRCFVDRLDLRKLGFKGTIPKATDRPSYHPSVLLKLYVYGYLNCVQSSRQLEKECERNLEVIPFPLISDAVHDPGTGGQ
jgi:hypothetical protein